MTEEEKMATTRISLYGLALAWFQWEEVVGIFKVGRSSRLDFWIDLALPKRGRCVRNSYPSSRRALFVSICAPSSFWLRH